MTKRSSSMAGGRHLRREHNSLSLNVDRGKTGGAPGLALFETWDSTVMSILGFCLMVLPSRRDFSSQPAADGNHGLPARPVRLGAPVRVRIQSQARVMSSASTNRM